MAKITKVPNGPLIKKKGPFKGSTLKTGGTIKKAQTGATMTKRDSLVANIKEQSRLRQNLVDFRKKVGNKPLTPELIREKDSLKGLLSNFGTKQRMKSTGLTEQQLAKNDSIYTEQQRRKKSEEDDSGQLRGMGNDKPGCSGSQRASERRVKREARRRNGGPIKKAQVGTYQPMNPRTKFKTRSEDGNYKLKLKGDKLVERRTLKGFFSGAPRAQGKMDLNADNVKLLKSLRSITNSNDLSSSKDKGVLKNKGTSWDSIRPKYPKSEFKFAANKNGGPVKKAKAGAMIKRAQNGDTTTVKKPKVDGFFKNIDKKLIKKSDTTGFYKGEKSKIKDDGFFKGPKVKSTGLKNGGMIKRADGSMSRRGLWDNLRSKAAQNKKTGAKPKSPTKAMLTQEKKIKAKSKK